MAEPSLELDAQDEGAGAPTYDIPIINGGTVDTDKVIRWGASDSADGVITNVTLPASGNKWGEEQWLEDLGAADDLLVDTGLDPDGASQPYMTYKLSSDDVAFATLPRITVYDSVSHTEAEEFIIGTTNHPSPFVKARGQTVTTAPPQYWGEASSAAIHTKETDGAITCGNATGTEENCALEGDTSYLESSALNIFTTPQYFILGLSVPDDATTGVDTINGVLSVRYTYT